jgi:hypothetical protein
VQLVQWQVLLAVLQVMSLQRQLAHHHVLLQQQQQQAAGLGRQLLAAVAAGQQQHLQCRLALLVWLATAAQAA